MTAIRDILNDTQPFPSNPARGSSRYPSGYCSPTSSSAIMRSSSTPASPSEGPDYRRLERMSLDFVAPGSRPAEQQTTSHHGYSGEQAHQPHPLSTEHNMAMRGLNNQHRPQYAHHPAANAQPWTPVNSGQVRHGMALNYGRLYGSPHVSHNTRCGINRIDALDGSDPDSPTGRNTSPFGEPQARREARHAYGEEERAFIMVCAVLRNMSWKEIEVEFRQRFPPGQKRRHPEVGLWPTYPEQERTAGGLTCAYYRIREQWGIEKVRGVPDDMKPEVKMIVKQMVASMPQFPDLQQYI